jgi:hypothetical protein
MARPICLEIWVARESQSIGKRVTITKRKWNPPTLHHIQAFQLHVFHTVIRCRNTGCPQISKKNDPNLEKKTKENIFF